ncbi:ATP-dependent Clp protease proteolytic subunit [Escherichia coli]|nr:ATP-dependent Clp protease proteolytic subunit [Escherichia coli]
MLCVRCVKERNINTLLTGDKQATIALATYGELFSITRQAIINDDLNMLTDVPMKLGRAAKSTIADLVYAILTSNPKISTDNVSLFDKAKHAKRTGERCNGRGIAG